MADVIVVGAGLAGLVATSELIDAGKRVLLLEQEPPASFGGQAFWSLGGLFMVGTPEQRRLGIHDSRDLALNDWMLTAGFDRNEDAWPRRWAEAYVDFASGDKRHWLRSVGLKIFPIVGWAERRYSAEGPGNSVPRFHLTWGTGPGVVGPFVDKVRSAADAGRVDLRFRHRVSGLLRKGFEVIGVSGEVLEPDDAARGISSSRTVVGEFEFRAGAVIIASGGIGGNVDLVRKSWPDRLGSCPNDVLIGVPAHVDGLMVLAAKRSGASTVNDDRMWHYTEGIENWDPVWPSHGIRILPGPSSLWLDASGNRLPVPFFPGFDTLGTLAKLRSTGFDHSWFVLNQAIIKREFALSGSEQNPDLTNRSIRLLASRLLSRGLAPGPVEAFKTHGQDFVVAETLDALLDGMQQIPGGQVLDRTLASQSVKSRDGHVEDRDDPQIREVVRARRYFSERLMRVASPQRLLDPGSGPLIAVRLRTLTRKTLGGIHTDLSAAVLDADGQRIPGLFAAGEAAGFGGGGMHGYRALEGSFLGGCLFSGGIAGRSAAN